jgi:hypothetical protein
VGGDAAEGHLLGGAGGKGLAGQVANLSGYLLERLRKAHGHVRAERPGRRPEARRAQPGAPGGSRKSLSDQDLEALVAKEPRAGNKNLFVGAGFHEGMTDGEGKLLTDGMRLAYNGEARSSSWDGTR